MNVMKMTFHHLCHIQLVRSKLQALPNSVGGIIQGMNMKLSKGLSTTAWWNSNYQDCILPICVFSSEV